MIRIKRQITSEDMTEKNNDCEIAYNILISSINKCQDVTYFNLSKCKLKYLPKIFGTLPHIRKLNLSNNCLGRFGWSWLKQVSIRKNLLLLDISYNSLPGLPEFIWELEALEELNISHNRLRQLPQGIENLRNLNILDLSHNRLTHLPIGITLLSLQIVNISTNPFADIIRELSLHVMIPSLAHFAAKRLQQYCRSENVAFQSSTLDEIISGNMIANCFFCEDTCTTPYKYAVISYRCYFVPYVYALVTSIHKQTKSTTMLFECYYCFPKCKRSILSKC